MRRLRLHSAIIVLSRALRHRRRYASPPPAVITTLSTSPDRVSGGDVAVRIDVPPSVALADVAVTLNGRDVTAAFRAGRHGHGLVGLVTGLR